MNRILFIGITLLLFHFGMCYGQERTISGVVSSSEDGAPLPGASVLVKGTSWGTITDSNGAYSLSVVDTKSILIFSSMGMVTQEISVETQSVVDVKLLVDTKELAVVVVNGYGSKSPLSTTGAIAQVKGKDIENTPFTSLDKALQGRVAGLQSTGGSGQPGSIQNIRIRGIGSMYTTDASQPLFVVDGIPINSGELARASGSSNALAGINPNDIESITVLKDAAASSIYGSRAANGVIIITTKKGRAGKTRFSASAEYGVANLAYISKTNKPLNTAQWRELTAEGLVNFNPTLYPNQEAALNQLDTTYKMGVDTDWIKEVTRTGKQMLYNFSADGGSNTTQFRISGGYFSQDGVILASEFKRLSTNLSVTHKMTDKLTFSTNWMVSNSTQKGPGAGGAFANPVMGSYFILPMYSPRNADGTSNISAPDFPNGSGAIHNPVAIAEMNKRLMNAIKGLGSMYAEYQILPNLKVSSKLGIDFNNIEEDNYTNPTYGDGRNDVGRSQRYYTRLFNWIWTNLVDYSIDINKDKVWVGNIKAGYESQKSKWYSSNVIALGFPTNTTITVPSAGVIPSVASGANSDYSFASALAMADFSYRSKYVISGSFRRDGSSRFGSQNRYGNFWSVGGSWNMEQEEFIKQIPWIDQLKLRGSYGLNGNANIGNYDWMPFYSYGGSFNYLGSTGSGHASIGNPDLTWEVNKQSDLGVDASVLKNRLNFSLELYRRITSKLLMPSLLPRTTGFTSFIENVGSMENKGIELSLSATPLKVGDFRWDASFNFSRNYNKILKLVGGSQIISSPFIRREGQDYQSFYLPLWAGVDPENGDPLWYKDSTRAETTNVIGQAQRAIAGSASPKAFGSFTSTFSFKGFSISALFYYNTGNKILDLWAPIIQSNGANPLYNKVTSQLNRWQKPGDITDVPKYVSGGIKSSSGSSSRYLYDGDYVRLRDLTIGYDVPVKWISKIKLTNAKFYIRGSNIWTWVKDKRLTFDPETFITSSPNLEIYIPKTYTIGINIGL